MQCEREKYTKSTRIAQRSGSENCENSWFRLYTENWKIVSMWKRLICQFANFPQIFCSSLRNAAIVQIHKIKIKQKWNLVVIKLKFVNFCVMQHAKYNTKFHENRRLFFRFFFFLVPNQSAIMRYGAHRNILLIFLYRFIHLCLVSFLFFFSFA